MFSWSSFVICLKPSAAASSPAPSGFASGGLESADLTIFANSRRAGSLSLYFFMIASKLTNS